MYNKSYYDERQDPDLQTFLAHNLCKLLNYNSTTKVLDIGCGRGWFVKTLNDLGIEACGIDISEYAVTSAVTDRLYLGDATDLFFQDKSFDLVVSLQTLEHIEQFENAISEMKRVVKPNGIILITTPKPNTKSAMQDPTHINVLPEDEWIRLFTLPRQRDIERGIIETKAEYYSKKQSSSLVGLILSVVPFLKKKALERYFTKENTTLCLEVKE